MHHAFDAIFELHERPIRHDADNPATHLASNRILDGDVVPRIAAPLLEAKRDAFLFAIDFKDHHLNLVANLHEFTRMIDATPAHVGDVQQAVQAVEINERAEIGEVLHRACARFADAHVGEQRAPFVLALLLDEFAARQDNILALLVDLDDFELESLAEEIIEVARRDDVDL